MKQTEARAAALGFIKSTYDVVMESAGHTRLFC